jgi:hypothetical protein
MRAATPLALLLTLAAAACGNVQVQQPITTNPSAAVPLTLAAGTVGTTTLGASATSATTTGAVLPPAVTATNLKALHGSAAWQVQLRATTASGLVGGITPDTITLGLTNGGTPQTIVLTSLSTYPLTTGAVTLAAAGPDLSVTSSGICLGTCPLSLQLLFSPVGSSSPAFAYGYSLTVT